MLQLHPNGSLGGKEASQATYPGRRNSGAWHITHIMMACRA
jgi:hypothetical protein